MALYIFASHKVQNKYIDLRLGVSAASRKGPSDALSIFPSPYAFWSLLQTVQVASGTGKADISMRYIYR